MALEKYVSLKCFKKTKIPEESDNKQRSYKENLNNFYF